MFYAAHATYGLHKAYGPFRRPVAYAFPLRASVMDGWTPTASTAIFTASRWLPARPGGGFAMTARPSRRAPGGHVRIIPPRERRPPMANNGSGSTIATLLLLPFVVLFAFVSALFGLAGKTK